MNDVFFGIAAWHGLKLLVGMAVVATFLATYAAPAQRARHQAEAASRARLAACLAMKPAAPDALGRLLDRATCRLDG